MMLKHGYFCCVCRHRLEAKGILCTVCGDDYKKKVTPSDDRSAQIAVWAATRARRYALRQAVTMKKRARKKTS
jgi:hypothetical protein